MNKMPASAPQPSRSHTALIWLIRGTGALTAGISVLVIALSIFGLAMTGIRTHGETISIATFVVLLFMVLFYGLFLKIGYDMFRKMNAATVANFSFVFAYFWATAWYHLLPLRLPKVISDYCGGNAFLAPLAEHGDHPGITYRGALSFIAFLLFYNLIKTYLMQILDLNAPNPPQNTIPSVPPDPSDPFVPFDPYDLSKNSPYRPPPQQL